MVAKVEDANSLALALTQIWVEHHSASVAAKSGAKPLDLDSVLSAYNTSRNWVTSYIIKDEGEATRNSVRPLTSPTARVGA